jgi:hypothetical protein
MEPLFYVMAIMGCGDMGDTCQQARVMPVRYQSAVACRMAMADALPRQTDLAYPVITAACQPSGVTMARTGSARSGG